MLPIKFGTQKVAIGTEEVFVRCPSCGKNSPADILVMSCYFHIYYIPVFPIEKEVSVICKECGMKRYNLPFDADIINNYEEIKSKFMHPWYTYSIIGAFLLLILLGILLRNVD